VRWQEYVGDGERRLDAGQVVWSVAADGDYVIGGLFNGSIGVWSRSTLELTRTLIGHRDTVRALLFVGGRLISGSDDRSIRVWDVASGQCEGVLEGHTDWVTSLASCGGRRLLSGSHDESVRVWGMDVEASRWRCERTLNVYGLPAVGCMAALGDRAACGCVDGGIRVWSTETLALERTLNGHKGVLNGMAVSGRRLISSSDDGTVRVWSTETWECAQMVEAYPAGSRQYIRCLAVCGSTLVGGPCSSSSSVQGEVRVWDLETLRPLQTLSPAAGGRSQPVSDSECRAT
jgi:WD40 repeat protein